MESKFYYTQDGLMPPNNSHVSQNGSRVTHQALGKEIELEPIQAYVLSKCDGESPRATVTEYLKTEFNSTRSLESILDELAEMELLVSAKMPIRYHSHVQEAGSEVLVYVPVRGTAHVLSPEIARVYAECDGEQPVAVVAEKLGGHEVVWAHLEQLTEKELVPKTHGLPSRRGVLKALATAAAAVPLISSVSLPAPAAATSCIQENTVFLACPPNDFSCPSCCSSDVSSRCQTACVDGCACFCMVERTRALVGGSCATDQVSLAPQNSACQTPLTGPDGARAQTDCALARAATPAGGLYYCCSNCT